MTGRRTFWVVATQLCNSLRSNLILSLIDSENIWRRTYSSFLFFPCLGGLSRTITQFWFFWKCYKKKSMLSWSGESPLRGWERAGWRQGRCRAWRTTSRRLAASRWRWAASNLKAQQSWEQLSVFTSLWGKDPFDFLCYSHLVSSGHGRLKIWSFGQLTIKGVRVDGVQINGQVSNIGELNGHIPNLLLTYNVVSTSRMVRLTSITMST